MGFVVEMEQISSTNCDLESNNDSNPILPIVWRLKNKKKKKIGFYPKNWMNQNMGIMREEIM